VALRADPGFARDAVTTWCEANGVRFVAAFVTGLRPTRTPAQTACQLYSIKPATIEVESCSTGNTRLRGALGSFRKNRGRWSGVKPRAKKARPFTAESRRLSRAPILLGFLWIVCGA
jgi:hypothetical protein